MIQNELLSVPGKGEEIISPSCWEKCCSCWDYTLTESELQKYKTLQMIFSTFIDINEEELYNSIKTFADEVFDGDDQYNELMNRVNEEEKKRKLLNYMGFLFDDISNDLKGIENIANKFFDYSKRDPEFVGVVRAILESPKILFGQTIGILIYNLKMYMHLESNRNILENIQKEIGVKMGRKEMKNFAKYLDVIYSNDDNIINSVFNVVCKLFRWFKEENSIQNIEIGNLNYWDTVKQAIINVIKKFHTKLSKDQWPINEKS